MTPRSFALTGIVLAAFTLAACDDTNDTATAPENEPEVTAEAPAETPPAPAAGTDTTAEAPTEDAEVAEAPAQDETMVEPQTDAPAATEPPAQVTSPSPQPNAAGEANLSLADLSGSWAPSADQCAAEAMTVSAEQIEMPEGDCRVVSDQTAGDSLELEVACEIGGTEETQTWSINAADGDASERIELAREDGETIELVRCG